MTDKDYRIRFAGEVIPAYEAWGKLETAQAALSVLEQFNRKRTGLATELTQKTEEDVRRRLAKIEVLGPTPPKKAPDLTDKVRALLLQHTPEEVISILDSEHKVDCDIHGLIHLAGTDAYFASLGNEVQVYSQNAITYEQVADLWNEAKRPSPGRPFWDASSVKSLIQNIE